MQIVINVDEKLYNYMQTEEYDEHLDKRFDYQIRFAVKDGKPIPEEHGRLIIVSEDKLKENQINLDFSCQKWISEVGLSNATVATIEADKIESEEI